jgi:hypothetical protein
MTEDGTAVRSNALSANSSRKFLTAADAFCGVPLASKTATCALAFGLSTRSLQIPPALTLPYIKGLANVARAKGMAQIAKESGLGRESLYKALARGAKPRYETVRKLVEALGVRLTVKTRARVVRSVRLRAPQIDARRKWRSAARSAVRFRGRPSLRR